MWVRVGPSPFPHRPQLPFSAMVKRNSGDGGTSLNSKIILSRRDAPVKSASLRLRLFHGAGGDAEKKFIVLFKKLSVLAAWREDGSWLMVDGG